MTDIFYKSKQGLHLKLDGDHYFKSLILENKEISVHRLKNVGWDGMLFISIKQWLIIKPHLKFLFNSDYYNYYQYISNN